MAKRKLAAVASAKSSKSPVDLAEELTSTPERAQQTAEAPSPGHAPQARFTDRMSISLLKEERDALEDRARDFQRNGRRDIKTSRLARVAFRLLLNTPDDEILRLADDVQNLERLRVKQA